MKKLLGIVVLGLCLITPSLADDISDFEIEGMSIGDSLLDHYTQSKLDQAYRKTKIEGENRYYFNSTSDNYDQIRVYTIDSNDETIVSITGIKKINYEQCIVIIPEIIFEIKEIFKDYKNTRVTSDLKDYISQNDASGKSFFKNWTLKFSNGDSIKVRCFNFTKESGFKDSLKVLITTTIHAYNIEKSIGISEPKKN